MAKDKNMARWRLAAVFFMLTTIALLIAVIVVAVDKDRLEKQVNRQSEQEAVVGEGGSSATVSDAPATDAAPTVFSGLTAEDIRQVTNILLSDTNLNLKGTETATSSDNYIYLIEDFLPPKAEVLAHLDGGGPMPAKQALAILYQGALNPPQNSEYVVDTGTGSVTLLRTHPWNSKPADPIETEEINGFLSRELKDIDYIIIESFNISLLENCSNMCALTFYVARAQPNSNDRYIYGMSFASERRSFAPYLHTISFIPIVKIDITTQTMSLAKLYYNGQDFPDVQSLKTGYDSGSIEKISVWNNSYDYYANNYGSPVRRGENTNPENKRPPFQVYPDGRRFSLDGTRVSYMGWSFDIHMKSVSTLELMNVKHKDQRIAYSLGLQDISVIYGDEAPGNFFRNYWDVSWLTGLLSSSLIRGVDCPHDALYLDARHYSQSQDGQSSVTKDSACVFEYRNSIPLRRHFNSLLQFGLADTVVVVRQISTIGNYDYIIDYEFHDNGVIELKVSSTGYIQTIPLQNYQNIDYGFLLDPQSYSIGMVHTHLFNMRIDLDIGGTANRFTKVEYTPKITQNPLDPSLELGSIAFTQNDVLNESEAATTYEFDKPKHYIIRNEGALNAAGNSRGYNVGSNSFVKMVVPENDTRLNGAEWAKKQLFVTKYKESEKALASFATNGNPHNPSVDFKDFVNGESVMDEDLVVWVTVGMHHIPVAEDIPVTTTPGKQLTVTLAPFNHFDEEPSIASTDAVLFGYGHLLKEGTVFENGTDMCYSNPPLPLINVYN